MATTENFEKELDENAVEITNNATACFRPLLDALRRPGMPGKLIDEASPKSIETFMHSAGMMTGLISSIMSREVLKDVIDYLANARVNLSGDERKELKARLDALNDAVMDHDKRLGDFMAANGLKM